MKTLHLFNNMCGGDGAKALADIILQSPQLEVRRSHRVLSSPCVCPQPVFPRPCHRTFASRRAEAPRMAALHWWNPLPPRRSCASWSCPTTCSARRSVSPLRRCWRSRRGWFTWMSAISVRSPCPVPCTYDRCLTLVPWIAGLGDEGVQAICESVRVNCPELEVGARPGASSAAVCMPSPICLACPPTRLCPSLPTT